MVVWSILAAPLIISVDLATIKPEFKEILLNKRVIAVNQDKLGKQGLRAWKNKTDKTRGHIELWKRDLFDGTYAVALVNLGDFAVYACFSYKEAKLPNQDYRIVNLFKKEKELTLESGQLFGSRINATSVKFMKFIPIKNSSEDTLV